MGELWQPLQGGQAEVGELMAKGAVGVLLRGEDVLAPVHVLPQAVLLNLSAEFGGGCGGGGGGRLKALWLEYNRHPETKFSILYIH